MSTGTRAAAAAATTASVALPALWSVLQLRTWWPVPLDAVVLAVVLALALPRVVDRTGLAHLHVTMPALLVGAAAALGCTMLLDRPATGPRVVGAVAFSLAVTAAAAARGLGTAGRRAAAAAGLPFTAVLVQPAPLEPAWTSLLWMLVGAACAAAWSVVAVFRTSWAASTDRRPVAGRASPRPATGAPPDALRPAVQLGVATGAAFTVGLLLDPDHLVWPVLTVLVVHGGSRGRAGVLTTATQRVVGALVGTAVATLLGGALRPGDTLALVALFGTLVLASALRELSYACWAAGATAALAFLYAYFGQSGPDLLVHRLGGVAVGGVLAVGVTWLVLPRPVSRRRRPRCPCPPSPPGPRAGA